MMATRHWLLRLSLAGNAFVIFYFAVYYTTKPVPAGTTLNLNAGDLLRTYSSSKGMSHNERPPPIEDIMPQHTPQMTTSRIPLKKDSELREVGAEPLQGQQLKLPDNLNDDNKKQFESDSDSDGSLSRKLTLQESIASREVAHMDFGSVDPVPEEKVVGGVENEVVKVDDQYFGISERVKQFPCDDYSPQTLFSQRGPFWVLYNYFKPRKYFRCDESITYTTHADFTFLDNLIPLLQRWEGPVSLALYSPGTDFNSTIQRIMYLRECINGSSYVRDYVSFHLFFDYKHTPKMKVPSNPAELPVNCSGFKETDTQFGEHLSTYRKERKLPYPVNVARNVAREMSTTHYILPSDIELYPSPNLIPDFLDMIRRNDTPELQRPNPNKLYVLSIFEIEANVTGLPQDKTELVFMLRNNSAIPFHKYVCSNCHRIPKAKEWIDFPVFPGLNIFHIGKRYKPYHHWEPIFIGTKRDPFYDERLTWEGRSDKMTQGYILCVLDYEFHILDNAFLIHRPGIKRTVTIPSKTPVVSRQNTVIAKIILPELKQLFGTRPGCYV